MHTDLEKSKEKEETGMIYILGQVYRLAYQLIHVVNFDVFAVHEFILPCAWWPSRSPSCQLNRDFEMTLEMSWLGTSGSLELCLCAQMHSSGRRGCVGSPWKVE